MNHSPTHPGSKKPAITFYDARKQYFGDNPDALKNSDLKNLAKSAGKFKIMNFYRLDDLPEGLDKAIIFESCKTDFTRTKAAFIFRVILSYAYSRNAKIRFRELGFLESLHLQINNDSLLQSPTLSEISCQRNHSLGKKLLMISQDKRVRQNHTSYALWHSKVLLLSDYFETDMTDVISDHGYSIIQAFPDAQHVKIQSVLNEAISFEKERKNQNAE